MKRNLLLLLAFPMMVLAACGGSDAAPAGDDDEPGAQATAEAPADPESGAVVGRCAVDARDGAAYGRITAVEADASGGDPTYQIQGEGGATWNKKAGNVRVVDCP